MSDISLWGLYGKHDTRGRHPRVPWNAICRTRCGRGGGGQCLDSGVGWLPSSLAPWLPGSLAQLLSWVWNGCAHDVGEASKRLRLFASLSVVERPTTDAALWIGDRNLFSGFGRMQGTRADDGRKMMLFSATESMEPRQYWKTFRVVGVAKRASERQRSEYGCNGPHLPVCDAKGATRRGRHVQSRVWGHRQLRSFRPPTLCPIAGRGHWRRESEYWLVKYPLRVGWGKGSGVTWWPRNNVNREWRCPGWWVETSSCDDWTWRMRWNECGAGKEMNGPCFIQSELWGKWRPAGTRRRGRSGALEVSGDRPHSLAGSRKATSAVLSPVTSTTEPYPHCSQGTPGLPVGPKLSPFHPFIISSKHQHGISGASPR